MTEMTDPVQALVDVLTLERLDDNLFRGGGTDNGRGRSFGGHVAAQSIMAAQSTVGEEFFVHSMHSYFLLPGDPTHPIIYDVDRIRDGRSFETRRVAARQHGRDIYYQTVNFHRHEEGYEHQDRMPEVIPPEKGLDLIELLRARTDHEGQALAEEWAVVSASAIGNSLRGLKPDERYPARQRVWLKINGELPDDPKIQVGAFTWMSDISLLGSTLAAHTLDHSGIQMASLDHSIWFHRPFRADEWWLYDQNSPSAQGGRGLGIGRVFTADGVLGATVAQEGIIRPPRG
ncbi:acyl-CoA thioesterase [Nocardioides sp. Kera G14]|uniref:acyl-CoA thioesterase n=1 Tax=Nocardioides sp. Kera G14 TaxID=2884264 RepID=UPI001D1263D1|nr:acyl-CoA thioesterase II [Nocardioides sp. Kera G14]UDY22331.1 acyl-CoA thioesterase II [Nocardioides sp. Kera G14]